MNCCSPVHLHYGLGCRWGPWAFRMDTGQITRVILVVVVFFTLVDRLTRLTAQGVRNHQHKRPSLPMLQGWPFFNHILSISVTEISVSWRSCHYKDPAGSRPRASRKTTGAPALFQIHLDLSNHHPSHELSDV